MAALRTLDALDEKKSDAVEARSELDLRIGASFTRLQTIQIQRAFPNFKGKVISYGPCQFPTLGFVVDRYLKVKNFVPEKFWKLECILSKDSRQVNFSWENGPLFDRICCLAIYQTCLAAGVGEIVSVKTTPSSQWAPYPLRTVELQKFGVRYLKIPSYKIMTIAEGLYNKGFISYPRTETDQFESHFDFRKIIGAQSVSPVWGPYATKLLNDAFRAPKKGKNNDKAHPPIHPILPDNGLSGDDKRVYEFIVRRFLGCCSRDAVGEDTDILYKLDSQVFHAKGTRIIERNYLDVYTYQNWNTVEVPLFTAGERISPLSLKLVDGKTTGPKLLTEADLIALMDANGIGTDATIHEHINKIIEREYVIKQSNGGLEPSNLGVALVEGYDAIGFEISLSKPFLRAKMESEMVLIAQGSKSRQAVVRENIEMYKNVFFKIVENMHLLRSALTKYCGSAEEAGRPIAGLSNNVMASQPRIESVSASNQENVPSCRCGRPSSLKTVAKEGPNKGKKFYGCTVCQFFEWSEASSTARSLPASSPLGSGEPLEKRCNCGLIAPRLQAKTGQNNGRWFHTCVKQSGKCGFFEWEDGVANARGGMSGGESITCYKCHQVGHYSSACPADESRVPPSRQGRKRKIT